MLAEATRLPGAEVEEVEPFPTGSTLAVPAVQTPEVAFQAVLTRGTIRQAQEAKEQPVLRITGPVERLEVDLREAVAAGDRPTRMLLIMQETGEMISLRYVILKFTLEI